MRKKVDGIVPNISSSQWVNQEVPDTHRQSPPPKNLWSPLNILLGVIVVSTLGSIVFFDTIIDSPIIRELIIGRTDKQPQKKNLDIASPTVRPTPIILLPDDGVKGNYSISQSDKTKGPTFAKVIFDPLDVQKDQQLTITVTLGSPSPISSVTGTLTGDTTSTPITLQYVSTKDTTNVWSATIPITDTLWYKYMLNLTATNASGTSSIMVAPRS